MAQTKFTHHIINQKSTLQPVGPFRANAERPASNADGYRGNIEKLNFSKTKHI
jgi:hypothetical protein